MSEGVIAVTVTDLTDPETDALLEALRRADAGEDALEFYSVERDHRRVSFAADTMVVEAALMAMEAEDSCDHAETTVKTLTGKVEDAVSEVEE